MLDPDSFDFGLRSVHVRHRLGGSRFRLGGFDFGLRSVHVRHRLGGSRFRLGGFDFSLRLIGVLFYSVLQSQSRVERATENSPSQNRRGKFMSAYIEEEREETEGRVRLGG